MTTSLTSSVVDFQPRDAVAEKPLVGLWRVAKGYRMGYISVIIGTSIAAVAKMGTFLLLGFLVDRVLGAGVTDGAVLLAFGLGFVVLAMIEGAATFFAGRMAGHTAESIARRLRNILFDHLQRLTFTYHGKAKTGDLVQRVTSDVDAIRRFFSEQAIGIGRLLLPFIINVIAILTLNVQLGLISILIIPFIMFVSVFFFKKISKVYDAYQNQEGSLSATLQENLTGVRIVKAFARQQYEIEKFDVENREKFNRGKRLLIWHAYYWPTTDVLSWSQTLIGWAVGSMMAINGTITVGTYLAYSALLIQIVWPIRNMGRLVVETSTGLVSYGRIADILKQEQEPLTIGRNTAPNDKLRGEVIFRDVEFRYEESGISTPVLQDINLHVKPGQVIALLGSTGSGKTSLVNLLPRFYEYTSGSVTLDGVELKEYSREFLRKNIGIVEQEPFLFSRTIRENISYGVDRAVTDAEIEEAAKVAAIHDSIVEFPQGYSTLVGEKGVTLSGGQKQRVALARTLLKNPRILLLDDSTSSVDTETEAEIREALNRLMVDRTTFIIAHRVQSVMTADLIVVLDKGRIVQTGTHSALVRQEGFYRQIYNLQSLIETELEEELNSVGLVL